MMYIYLGEMGQVDGIERVGGFFSFSFVFVFVLGLSFAIGTYLPCLGT